ncbi:MAG: hypothetical protein IKJ59_16385 [Clostridia bacterium]|nr:hypothetical protein [Clostridia bacterium]MBR3920279.1 hypothetical protein [Clostridia bacterium]
MNFIEDFYYGNIEPQTRNIKQNSDFQKDFSRLCEIEAELRTKLSGGEKKLFLEYVDLWGIISGDIDFDSYKTGFRHGAAFAADTFNIENN